MVSAISVSTSPSQLRRGRRPTRGRTPPAATAAKTPASTPPWWSHSKDEPVEYRQTGAAHARRTRASTHGGVLGLRVEMERSQSHRHHRHQTAAAVVAQRQQLTPRCPRSSTHSAPCSTTAKPSPTARSSNSDPTVRQNSRRSAVRPSAGPVGCVPAPGRFRRVVSGRRTIRSACGREER